MVFLRGWPRGPHAQSSLPMRPLPRVTNVSTHVPHCSHCICMCTILHVLFPCPPVSDTFSTPCHPRPRLLPTAPICPWIPLSRACVPARQDRAPCASSGLTQLFRPRPPPSSRCTTVEIPATRRRLATRTGSTRAARSPRHAALPCLPGCEGPCAGFYRCGAGTVLAQCWHSAGTVLAHSLVCGACFSPTCSLIFFSTSAKV